MIIKYDPVCETLTNLLKNGLDIHRTIAAQALGRMGYSLSVPNLIDALLDEDSDVRTDAAQALLELNDPVAAAPMFENLLGDPCPEVKLIAIQALADWGHAPLIPLLKKMIKGRTEDIIWDEEEFYETGWDDWLDIQIKVIEALAKLGVEDSVPDIVEAIDDDNAQDITEIAFQALGKLGDAGTKALLRYAVSNDQRRRRRAIAVLGTLGGETASKAIIKALQDTSASVRVQAGLVLAQKNPADKHLEMLLLDKKSDVRAQFVGVCGAHFPDRLAALLFDKSSVVQAAVLGQLIEKSDVVEELGLMGRLLEIFTSPDGKSAGLAAQAMMAVAPDEMENEIIESLIEKQRPLDKRLGAAKALGMSESEDSLNALKTILGDDNRQLRLDAMMAIARRAQSDHRWADMAMEILQASLRGETVPEPELMESEVQGEVHEEVHEQIQEDVLQGDEENLTPVAEIDETIGAAQPMIKDEVLSSENDDPQFPATTLAALMGAPSESVDAALAGEEAIELSETDIEFLELTQRSRKKKTVSPELKIAPYQDVRRFAARLLGDFKSDDIAITLAEAADQHDRELSLTAIDSLALLGEKMGSYPDQVIDVLLGKLEDVDQEIRFQATRAYAQIPSRGKANILKNCLRDPYSFVRTEAIRGLATCIGTDEMIISCLDDEIPAVRLAAVEVLAPRSDDETVRRLARFALQFEGYHVRQVAQLLRHHKSHIARNVFLETLEKEQQKRVWKVAIEGLEILGKPISDELMAA